MTGPGVACGMLVRVEWHRVGGSGGCDSCGSGGSTLLRAAVAGR